jgi:peptidoglycan/LPS O-acetylase OafA/YrhL
MTSGQITGKNRFTVLDSLRGLAALAVVLFHWKIAGPLTDNEAVRHAWLYVDFFFVLSGFVLAHTYFYGRAPEPGRYALARVARLLPLYFYTLFVFLGFECLKAALGPHFGLFKSPAFAENDAKGFFESLFLLQALNVSGHLSWNTPSWTISAELAVNLGLILIWPLLAAKPARLLAASLGIAVMAHIALRMLGHTMDLTYSYGWLRCLYGISTGLAAYALYRRFSLLNVRANLLFTAAEILLAAAVFVATAWGGVQTQFWLPVLYAAAIVVFAHERGALSALLLKKAPVFLGRISYSLYLNQAIVMIVMLKLCHAASPGDNPAIVSLFVILNLAVLAAYSALTCLWIEEPARRLIRQAGERRRVAAVLR